jgi:predicted transcriptional regulator
MKPLNLNYHKRRDRFLIIAEILETAKPGALKTQIMYRANLSFTQLHAYLNFLLKIKLLDKTLENNRTRYRTTKKGANFIQQYREITELFKMSKTEIEETIQQNA